MEGMMGRSRSGSIRILLIALAIQGITPDAHDLASHMLFRMLSFSSSKSGA
jgi:hypothetical protein